MDNQGTRPGLPEAASVLRSPYGLHGIFLGSHAVSEGFASRKQLQSGLYRRLVKNVYANPALAADHRLFAHGVMLALPGQAVLAGRSAAGWFGAPFAAATDPVVVLAPPDATWRGPRGVQVHRAVVAPEEIRTVEDDLGIVRVTDASRTAWDLAALETVTSAVGYLDGMARAGHLDAALIERLLAGAAGKWRAGRVRKVLPLVDGRAESPPESWVRVACVRAGLPAPVPQFAVVHHGVFLGRVDLAWPEHGLVVEYEGAYHFDGTQIALDDARIARLVAAGWRVVRVAAHDLRDMPSLVARIAGELRAASTAKGLSVPKVP